MFNKWWEYINRLWSFVSSQRIQIVSVGNPTHSIFFIEKYKVLRPSVSHEKRETASLCTTHHRHGANEKSEMQCYYWEKIGVFDQKWNKISSGNFAIIKLFKLGISLIFILDTISRLSTFSLEYEYAMGLGSHFVKPYSYYYCLYN